MTKRRHHILLSSANDLLQSKKLKPTDVPSDDVSRGVKDLRSRRIFSPPKIIGDLGFGIGDHKRVDLGSGDNNGVGLGNDECVEKDPNPENKLVVKTSLRRKVFKVPGSHSYNRMLPFLIDMAKDDTCSFTVSPCIPKIEKLDLDHHKSKDEDNSAQSDGIEALENEDMSCGNELSHEAPNSNELNISEIVGDIQSHEDLKEIEVNLSSVRVESTEEPNVPEIDQTDLGISSDPPNSSTTNQKIPCLVNSSNHESEDEGTHGLEQKENRNTENFNSLLPREAPDLKQLNLSKSEEYIELDNQEREINDNFCILNKACEVAEEYFQTTTPVMIIFSDPNLNMVVTEESPKEKIVIENDNIAHGDLGEDVDQLNVSGSEDGLKIASNCEESCMDLLNSYESEGSIQLDSPGQKRNENDCSANGVDEYTEEHIQMPPEDMSVFCDPVTNMVDDEESPNEKIVIENDSIAREDAPKDLDKLNVSRSRESLNRTSNGEAPAKDQLNLSGYKDLGNMDREINENGSGSNGVGEDTEEHVQRTPPDVNIFSNPEIDMVENEESPVEKIMLVNNLCLKKGSTLKKKAVLIPCSRKVFKSPGSFSYRRLLPYLMEVSNDNPHSSPNAPKSSLHLKTKADPEERKVHKNLPRTDLKNQEPSYSSKESSGSDLWLNPPTAILTSNADSSDNKLKSALSAKRTELEKPFGSPNKCNVPVEQVISDILKDIEHASGGENSEIDKKSPVCAGENETMHINSAQSKSSQGMEARKWDDQNEKSSRVEEPSYVDSPVIPKGILRRNPRGCRGLCHCLNCTSFRLNADRAFEFSRNQMLDAEEVALDLIKELSSLRNMLKESTVHPNGQVTPGINQVISACNKALKAEELAKYRLKEMNSDLSAHCRNKILERPQVRFSTHNKETVIAKMESPKSRKG